MTRFHDLAELAEQLSAEPKKLAKRAAIAEALSRIHASSLAGEDAGRFALYLAGSPFAEADPCKLNAGGALLSKALLKVSGAPQTALTAAYRRHGDIGDAGYELLGDRTGDGLTLDDLAQAFAAMATAKTTAIRAALLEGLLERASALEARYLLKLIAGDMRIGVKQSLVEEAIAAAASAEVAAVRRAVMLEADLALAVERAFAGTLAEATMRLFHPLGFMLASPVDSPEEAAQRFTEDTAKRFTEETEAEAETASNAPPPRIAAFLEDKYDGMRAQVHCGDATQPGRVAIYSRNREDVTESFPELAEAFAGVPATENGLIFDGEILGWDLASARALPFAVLGQRIGRRRVTNEWRERVPVVFMAFDLMAERGELLLELPLEERRNRLEAVVERLVAEVRSPIHIDERSGGAQGLLFAEPALAPLVGDTPQERLLLAPTRIVASAEEIDRAYAEARARANEGVMLKAAGSPYLPGRRGMAWMKLKRELATLDVVVTAAEFGHGRRAGILSDYTFAVRDAEGELKNVGKAYSGLTDAEIAAMSRWMMDHTLEDQGYLRTVEPQRVLEVAFNNIMRSSRHASGFALRFPRIVRLRDDKPLAEIDTVARVEEIYESQVDKPVEPAE